MKLFFDKLDRAGEFYTGVLGLRVDDDDPGYFAAYRVGSSGFFCIYQRESPADKAILTFDTPDIQGLVKAIGEDRFTSKYPRSAWLEDPEGYTISIVE